VVDLGIRRPAALRLELLLATTALKKGMSRGIAPMKGNQRLATIAAKKDTSLAIAPTLLQPVVVADPNATNADKWVILQGHALRTPATIRDGVVASVAALFVTLAEERAI